MIYMIRNLFLIQILLLSSCAFLQYDDILLITKQQVFGVDQIEPSEELISAYQESFLIINIGKIKSFVMVLNKINKDGYYWQSNDGVRIVTNRFGKILKTSGLDFNFEIIEDGFDADTKSYEGMIMLLNPRAIIQQDVGLVVESKKQGKSIHERVFNNNLKSTWNNFYYIDANGFPVSTKQKTHPNLPEIEMSFYFKFN